MKLQKNNKNSYKIESLHHIGVYENSIHFIFDHNSKTCAIVDPAWNADLFIQKITKKGYKLTDVWLTHWHDDHVNAVDEIAKKTGAKITIGVNEIPYLEINSEITTVNDGDIISLGDTKATVINTPGHTAGGVCYLLDHDLIVGDTLFVYGAGHCSAPGGNMNAFFHSMQKLRNVDDDIALHCGHDYGIKISTTMGEQKNGNAFLMIDKQEDFVRYIKGMQQGLIAYPIGAVTKKEIELML